jgi:glycosyltransferase involved in cell wall biosynthesis
VEKYSVLMSVYEKENKNYLIKSIESMINQTVIPDEILIVKDGPLTPELDEVLHNYINNYPELFTIIISKENIGLGSALNLGLRHCRNELIARMDTDDISLPDRCEKQLKEFQQDRNLALVGGTISEFIDNETNIVGRRFVPSENNEIREYLKKRCPFNHVTVMFKKSEVIKIGSYLDWFWNEDYYLWIRMFENGCKFKNLSSVLVNVRVGKDMYKRRGGFKYFKSEFGLQKYMYNKKIINTSTCFYNVTIRFVLQVLMPNNIRGYIFKKFARS